MKLFKVLPFLLALSIILFACKKKDNPIVLPPAAYVPDYAQLKTGNYWIYRSVWKDTLGNELGQTAEYDSNYINGDTMIGVIKYAKLWQVSYTPGQTELSLRRDSSGCIVDEKGNVFFSLQSVGTILQEYYRVGGPPADTSFKMTLLIDGKNVPVTTPAGTFMANGIKQTYKFAPYTSTFYDPRSYHTYYADSVGVVVREMVGYTSGYGEYVEKRLVRYHVR